MIENILNNFNIPLNEVIFPKKKILLRDFIHSILITGSVKESS